MEDIGNLYSKILKAFRNCDVRYLIIGGYAVNYHGVIRATMDLDIWTNGSDINLKKLYESLLSLGYDQESCQHAIEALKNDHIIKIPFENELIEIMDDSIVRLDFDKAFENRIEVEFENVLWNIIGLDELITIKSKSNRFRDLDDVRQLKDLRDK